MGCHPITLTQAQKAEVETLAAVLTAEQIADFFGIGRRTFFAMMHRVGEIAERYKRGKARAIGAIAQTLISKARVGDTMSMIFYLKTQAEWRETATMELAAVPGEMTPSEVALRLFSSTLVSVAAKATRGTEDQGLVYAGSPMPIVRAVRPIVAG